MSESIVDIQKGDVINADIDDCNVAVVAVVVIAVVNDDARSSRPPPVGIRPNDVDDDIPLCLVVVGTVTVMNADTAGMSQPTRSRRKTNTTTTKRRLLLLLL